MEIEIWDDTTPRRNGGGKKGESTPTLTVYKKGRIQFNKALCERLGLKEGRKISFFKNGSRRGIYLEIDSPTGIVLSNKKNNTSTEVLCNHSVIANKIITALGLSTIEEQEGKLYEKSLLKLNVDLSLKTIEDRQGYLLSNANIEDL